MSASGDVNRQQDPDRKRSPTLPQAEHRLPVFLGLEHTAASHCRACQVYAAFRDDPHANSWYPPKPTVESIRIQLMLALCWPELYLAIPLSPFCS